MRKISTPALCTTALIGWLVYTFIWPTNGVNEKFVGSCDAGLSVVVKSSSYTHLLSLVGDATGYGVFLRVQGQSQDVALWNDAFSATDYPFGFPAPYVGWSLEGNRWKKTPGRYLGPRPTHEFAPVPDGLPGSQVRIFEVPPPSEIYRRNAMWGEVATPRLMNIFIPPASISEDGFRRLGDCLAVHRGTINRALARVGADFSYRGQGFYKPLRLGALVHGLPPWSDIAYVTQIRRLYRDAEPLKPLPEVARFTLYKGQTVQGVVDGRTVRISILPAGATEWQIDGTTLPDQPSQADVAATGLRGVVASSNGLVIGESICHVENLEACAKRIEPVVWNNDGSTQFWITLRADENVWVSDIESLRRQ